ncbi:MAG: hypothetical protein ACRDRI_06730 [Pseudonocardiaceae bacterium]
MAGSSTPPILPLMRAGLVVLVATVAALPALRNTMVWMGLRGPAVLVRALIFVIASNPTLERLRGRAEHLTRWGLRRGGAGCWSTCAPTYGTPGRETPPC